MVSSRACSFWLTGLPGAGKTAITSALVPLLKARGCKVEVLDGDIVCTNLSQGLVLSEEDRDTNISDPYEPPDNPEVICDTDRETPSASAQKIVRQLEQLGYLAPLASSAENRDGAYIDDEEELVKQRLEVWDFCDECADDLSAASSERHSHRLFSLHKWNYMYGSYYYYYYGKDGVKKRKVKGKKHAA